MFEEHQSGPNGPAINVPQAVLLLIAVLALIQLGRGFLSEEADQEFVLTFAFIPARYSLPTELASQIPGGEGADIWSFVTHMFLHGDWMHLGFNALWMLAFGSVVARRLGAAGFMALSLASAAAGALANLVLYWGALSVLIGASGAISGQMAGAVRLMFADGGSLGTIHRRRLEAARPLGLVETFANPRALLFILIWFGITLFTGIGGIGAPGEEARIAWEAHVGGFAGGLLLFGFIDSIARRPRF
jgi:membrane associated rhomboid family serine protease